ncbi:MAG: hypothetical protein P4L45_13005 [Ignavibacteriaceae bacterium]|nr:hypothetical protein [Ignavibacteriaceae bacterium]
MLIKGDNKKTVIIIGCGARNYVSVLRISIEKKNAVVQVVAYIDKNENPYNYVDSP